MTSYFSRWVILLTVLMVSTARGQIDPEKRQLVQFGYNQPIEGKAPIAGYAFYYLNDPGFIRTNLTLRLIVAPVFLDSELGIHGSGNTDYGIGLAGGGFADSYNEIRSGRWLESESFIGHGGEVSFSLYHRVNPHQKVPLSAIFRLAPHYATFERDSDTARGFVLPPDHVSADIRTGLRLGGVEPIIFPELAMELSLWHESQVRSDSGTYGFNDRQLNSHAHLFWGRALLIYTLTNLNHTFALNLTGGTSVNGDRFSAYRVGGFLPLASEFPLNLPGYFYQELSAERFGLLSTSYIMPLDARCRWTLTGVASTGQIDYSDGLEQSGKWHAGVGAAIGYKSPREILHIVVGYSYGINAIRDHGRGGQNIGILFQWDLEARHRQKQTVFDVEGPYRSRGLFEIFGDWFGR